ncbi:MAG: WD40 repeat domain-containing protein [Cyclobacteriaceae bacterium]|nr:WD40 repeat domain-containing protein [Cyclobacteriaceae bacterium]
MSAVEVTKLHTFSGHHDCVYTLARSNSTHLFFSGAGDGMIASWDLTNPDKGQLIAKLPNSVYSLHHHPGNGLLIAGHNYDGIHLIDWENKKEVGSLKLTTAAIFDIQSHANFVFTASGDGMINQIDIRDLTIKRKAQVSTTNVRTLAVNEVSGELAVGSSDHFIRILDLETLAIKAQWQAHANSVFSVCWSPDRQFLLSGSRDARLKQWDRISGFALSSEVVAHLFAINHIEFSPDGKHFVTCSMDKSIKVWDAEAMKLLKVIDKSRHAGHGTSVNKLLWTTFNDQLVSASDDRSISVWEIIF